MDKLNNIEYGENKALLLSLNLTMLNPETGLALQYNDLYTKLYIKSDLDDVTPTVEVDGVFDSDLTKFKFLLTQEQANLLTVGVWYYGFEIRLVDINGKVLHRHTYLRKIISTGAKE